MTKSARPTEKRESTDPFRPVLIAGPTASGKTALSLKLAQDVPSLIINADALQVYTEWNILSARPSDAEVAKAPHHLFGHIPLGQDYSVGHWLREVAHLLSQARESQLRPIIIGGTGLYFQALTNGLADIPNISIKTKELGDRLEAEFGLIVFKERLLVQDPKVLDQIDANNPMRTRRAWEVLEETGKSITQWQEETPKALLPQESTRAILLECDTDWLNERINRRFDLMIKAGAIEECRAVLEAGLWDPNHPSCKAIGAKELIEYIQGSTSLEASIDAAKMQTRQFAKRQRTWFRSKMKAWEKIDISCN